MDEENIPFKVSWKHVDIKPDADYKGEKTDMRAFALKTAVSAFNKPDNSAEKDIAAQIKKECTKSTRLPGTVLSAVALGLSLTTSLTSMCTSLLRRLLLSCTNTDDSKFKLSP
jgi:hypothetical protein